MKYRNLGTADEEFEAYRLALEDGLANAEDVEDFYRFMGAFGEHWNGEEWTYECIYPLEGTSAKIKQTWCVRPVCGSIFEDEDYMLEGFRFTAGRTEYINK